MSRVNPEQQQAIASTWVSVWVNLVLASTQVVVGYFARSQALIADGIHSLSDLLADGVVLFAARHSHADADEDHPYGHARFETAASLAIGLILLLTGLGMVWSAGVKLHAGVGMDAVHPVALAIALFTLVAKEALFQYMRRVGERLKSSMLIANAWHARADAASSLVVALGIGANLLGYHSMDTVAAIIVGFMIARAGWGFSVEAFHSLTDHALDPEEIKRIHNTALLVDGVRGIHELRTRRMGDWAVIDLHVEVDSDLTVSEGHYIAERISEVVRQTHRVAECTVHIDPLHARRASRVLDLPTRPEILTQLQPLLPGPATYRLHYLESGMNIEVELQEYLPAAQLTLLAQLLQETLARTTRVDRISVRSQR